jgi:F0F1-type ATP synthase alpha subunit
MAENYPDIMEKIRRTKDLDKDTEAALIKAIDAFKANFKA